MINVFDLYYGTLVGMAMHPGFNRDNVVQPNLEECAEIAQKMVEIRNNYVKEENQ